MFRGPENPQSHKTTLPVTLTVMEIHGCAPPPPQQGWCPATYKPQPASTCLLLPCSTPQNTPGYIRALCQLHCQLLSYWVYPPCLTMGTTWNSATTQPAKLKLCIHGLFGIPNKAMVLNCWWDVCLIPHLSSLGVGGEIQSTLH